MVLGLIGIVLALAVFYYMVYKGHSSYWVAAICVVIVAVFNSLNIVEAFTSTFIIGITDMILSTFSIIFLGAILGKVMTDSGAAVSIANGFAKIFLKGKTGDVLVKRVVLLIIIFACLCTYGGIAGYVLAFTLFPVSMKLSEQADIPRRFIPAFLCASTGIMAAPGAPQINNIVSTNIMGVGRTAGLVPGIIGALIVEVGIYFFLTRIIIRAKKKGETFSYGNVTLMQNQKRPLPNFVCSIIPLLCVFILYTIIGLDVSIGLTVGILACLILCGKYITFPIQQGDENKKGFSKWWKNSSKSLSLGAESYPGALLSVCTPAGLAAVITSTAAFGALIGKLSGLSVNVIVFTIIFACIIVALTSSPPAALAIVLPTVLSVYVASGLSTAAPGAIARVAAVAVSTFETLPCNGLILLALALCKCSHKESYMPLFVQTVLFTLLATVVEGILFLVFPGMA